MDFREDFKRELPFKRENLLVSGRDVLQDATRTLTENDWEMIEAELKRAIR